METTASILTTAEAHQAIPRHLGKDTYFILCITIGTSGLLLITNFIFSILYGCCPYRSTTKQRLILQLLNLGLILNIAVDVYNNYYEYAQWSMDHLVIWNCKLMTFVSASGFGFYIYSLITLSWDSIKHLQMTILLGKEPNITKCLIAIPLLTIIFIALAIATIPTIAVFYTSESSNTTKLCDTLTNDYGYIFNLYSKFHEITWFFALPIIIFMFIYAASMMKFGCSGDVIEQHITACDDLELAHFIKAHRHWFVTVRCLVLIYIAFVIPIIIFKILMSLLEDEMFFKVKLPDSVTVYLERLIMILRALLALCSQFLLIVRHQYHKKQPATGIEVT